MYQFYPPNLLTFAIYLNLCSRWATALGFPYYSPDVFPDSLRDFKRCGLTSSSLVCDPDGILGPDIWKLHEATEAVKSTTNCSCRTADTPLGSCMNEPGGYSISVAVMNKILVHPMSGQDRESLERIFPEALRRKQDRAHCDDDVLILLAVKNEIIATSIGSVARRKLHKELVEKVVELAKFRYLDNGEYARGLTLMVEIFGKVLSGQNYLEALPSRVERIYLYRLKRLVPNWPLWLTLLMIVGLPGFVLLAVVFAAMALSFRRYCRSTRYGYLASTSLIEDTTSSSAQHSQLL